MTTPHPAITFALFCAAVASGQTVMSAPGRGGPVILLPQDAAVLESREKRVDFPCAVKPLEPELGFDFSYHSGYEIRVPLREVTGSGNDLTAVFRVTPEGLPHEPVYFSQKWKVPAIDEDATGAAVLRGSFVLGEGTYEVTWLMRDKWERICSTHWQISTDRRGRDRQVPLRIPPGSAIAESKDPFTSEAPITRDSTYPLRVLVLLHVAPQFSRAASLSPEELEALMAMLRSVAREPRIGNYSLVAFNLDRSEILFRQTSASQIDFPALGRVVSEVRGGTVELQRLIEKDSEAHFLSKLIAEEVMSDPPDALIFIGPKASIQSPAVERSLKLVGDLHCPAFYLNYVPDPVARPWRDLIGTAVKFWKGQIYTITKPRDLSAAWAEVMAHLVPRTLTVGAPGGPTAINSLTAKK